MVVVDKSNINLASLVVDDIYVVVTPPNDTVIPGIPTDTCGIVGTATRGPVNVPMPIGSISDLLTTFGNINTTPYDLVTEAVMALKQGANNIFGIRVTDGTDVAASFQIQDNATPTPANAVKLTAKYTGTWGNSLKVTTTAGTAANSIKVKIEYPGEVPEVFDNIATGTSFATNIVNAINNGTANLVGPSRYVTASTTYAGSQTSITFTSQSALTGGTDGATGVTGTQLQGTDGTSSTRTGMYALRGVGVRQFILAGLTDNTTWANQLAFGNSEGCLPVLTMPTGTSSSTFVTTKQTAGIDDYHAVFVKDWLYINDTYNKLPMRLVSPLGAALGRIATLSPELNPGNKPIYGIVATERTFNNLPYSDAELTTLEQAGIIPITNPVPRGYLFGLRHGQNASSNPDTNTINYSRMTLFLAYSLNAVLGQFVCEPHTADLRRQVVAAITAFLSDLQTRNMIGDPNGGPAFSVKCDKTNNSDSEVALGYLNVDVQVRYLAGVRFFVVGLMGGQTVKPIVTQAA